MDEKIQPKFSVEVERKAEELRHKSFQEESKYIDNESVTRAKELVSILRSKQEQLYEEKLSQLENEKRKAESDLKNLESEINEKIVSIINKKAESRIEAFKEQRHRAEEERRRLEELERQRTEEEERRKREEETKRLEEERKREEEEAKQREEEEKRQKEEEQERRLEDEQRRREEELRAKEKEKQERIKTLLDNAMKYFEVGDYEHSLVEVAKALVNDPQNTEALELEAKIKNLQQEFIQSAEMPEAEKKDRRTAVKEKSIRLPVTQKKPSRLPMIISVVIFLGIILALIVFQLHKSTTEQPLHFAVLPWTSDDGNLEVNILGSALAEEVARMYKSTGPAISLDYNTIERITQRSSDPTRAAFNLGIERLLIGEINKTGNNFTFELKLVDSSGREDWSNSYLRSWSSLSNLPTEIARSIINKLNINQNDVADGFRREPTSANPDAYFFYLRGTELMHRRTFESVSNAYDLFLQASQQDPKFADALAASGEALMYCFEENWTRGDSIMLRIRHFAEAAVNAEPQLDRGYILLAKDAAYNMKYQTALSYLDSAAALSPNNNEIYLARGKILFRMGRYTDGLYDLLKGLKLNPNDPDYLSTVAWAYQLIGDARQSLTYHDKAAIFSDDSIAYLTSHAIETITLDPELRLAMGSRFLTVCEEHIKNHPEDYQTLYRTGRLNQLMGIPEANRYFGQLENTLQLILRNDPRDAVAMVTLGLTLTRKGQFAEGATLARRAISMASDNPDVLYKTAQLFTLQMYSPREKKLDENKKNDAMKYLAQAVRLNYRLNEITSADFYNILDRPEFRAAIEVKK